MVLNSFTDRPEDHALAAELAHGARRDGALHRRPTCRRATECRALIEKAGGCDILVNNAGIQLVAPIEEFPVDEVGCDPRDQPDVGLPHHGRRPAGDAQGKGWGRIVNIASAHGLTASPFKIGLCRGQARASSA